MILSALYQLALGPVDRGGVCGWPTGGQKPFSHMVQPRGRPLRLSRLAVSVLLSRVHTVRRAGGGTAECEAAEYWFNEDDEAVAMQWGASRTRHGRR